MIAEEYSALIQILFRCCSKNCFMVTSYWNFLLSGEGSLVGPSYPGLVSELQDLFNEWNDWRDRVKLEIGN